MSDSKLTTPLLDALIEQDPEAAERLIETHLARAALKKRLQEKKNPKALAAHEKQAEQQAGEAVARVRVTSVTPGRFDEIDVLRPLPQGEYLLYTRPLQPLSDEQIEQGREAIFSTSNPFCPCDSKTMRKAVRWAERAHGITKDTK